MTITERTLSSDVLSCIEERVATFWSPTVRARVYGNLVARAIFMDWAIDNCFEVSTEGSFAEADDVISILEVADVMVGGRRINVSFLSGPNDSFIRVDRYAFDYGLRADLYVFVELDWDKLCWGKVAGFVSATNFACQGTPFGQDRFLVLWDPNFRPINELSQFLRYAPQGPQPTLNHEMPHSLAEDRISSYVMGNLREAELGILEAHVFRCRDCRINIDTYLRTLACLVGSE